MEVVAIALLPVKPRIVLERCARVLRRPDAAAVLLVNGIPACDPRKLQDVTSRDVCHDVAHMRHEIGGYHFVGVYRYNVGSIFQSG